MASLFWTVATSYAALTIDGIILLIALVVGYFPLAKYLPVVGPYAEAAKLLFAVMLFVTGVVIGHRIADETADAKSLRAQLAAKTIDLTAANDAAKQADEARNELAAQAIQDEQRIKDYADALKKRPNAACLLTPDDFTDGVRH